MSNGWTKLGTTDDGGSLFVRPLPEQYCPHGDKSCDCAWGGQCRYERDSPYFCPNPPEATNRCDNLTFAHCHMEGCEWHVRDCAQRVSGDCGLLKLGLPPLNTIGGQGYWSMTQAQPGKPGFMCGWLRSSGNEPARESGNHD